MSDNEDEEFEEMYFSEEGSPSSGEEDPLQGPGPSAQMLQEKELQEAVNLKRKQERVNMDPRVPQKRVTFYEEEDMEEDFFLGQGKGTIGEAVFSGQATPMVQAPPQPTRREIAELNKKKTEDGTISTIGWIVGSLLLQGISGGVY